MGGEILRTKDQPSAAREVMETDGALSQFIKRFRSLFGIAGKTDDTPPIADLSAADSDPLPVAEVAHPGTTPERGVDEATLHYFAKAQSGFSGEPLTAEKIAEYVALGVDVQCLEAYKRAARPETPYSVQAVRALVEAEITPDTVTKFSKFSAGYDGWGLLKIQKAGLSLDIIPEYPSFLFARYITELAKGGVDGATASSYPDTCFGSNHRGAPARNASDQLVSGSTEYVIALAAEGITPEMFLAYPERFRVGDFANMAVVILHKAGVTPEIAASYPPEITDARSLALLHELGADPDKLTIHLKKHRPSVLPYIFGCKIDMNTPESPYEWGVNKLTERRIYVDQAMAFDGRFNGHDIASFSDAGIPAKIANSYSADSHASQIVEYFQGGWTPEMLSSRLADQDQDVDGEEV